MDVYPVVLRIDRPTASSRLWALLTIVWVKFIALIPHGIILWVLGLAQFIAFLVAQVAVLLTGVYPRGLHDFNTGVLRWQTRVAAFALSLTDTYPPFSLQSLPEYPIDVEVDYPETSSRAWAGLTLLITAIALIGFGAAVLARPSFAPSWRSPSSFGNWLVNGRDLILLPHFLVLFFIGIGVFVVFLLVQWVILFTGRYPEGLHEFSAGFLRWSTRVTAWSFGLIEPYPPFTLGDTTRSPGPTNPLGDSSGTSPGAANATWNNS